MARTVMPKSGVIRKVVSLKGDCREIGGARLEEVFFGPVFPLR